MTEFCIMGLEFKNIIVEFVFSLSLVQKKKKKKKLNLGPEISYLVLLRLEFENYIIIFEIRSIEFA